MADSDDEYDRKRRDKFRGERAEASYRGAERASRPRDDWAERDSWSRPRPRDYRPGVRDRGYSPSLEPVAKRMRHDYYGDSYYNHYMPFHQTHRPGNFFREQPPTSQGEGQQPPLMSFKAFLATQDDNISDSEAIEKYNDYKLEFQRQQLNEFFVAHKDDEWFRMKYHPEESVKRKNEQMAALKKRLDVFLDLMKADKIGVPVDCAQTSDLLKLLDTVVIKLENGTDEDLAVLDNEYVEIEEKFEEKYPEKFVEKFPEKCAEKFPDKLPDFSDKYPLVTNTVNVVAEENWDDDLVDDQKVEPEPDPDPEEDQSKSNNDTSQVWSEDGELENDKVDEEPPKNEEITEEVDKMEVEESVEEEDENKDEKEENNIEKVDENEKKVEEVEEKPGNNAGKSYSGSSNGSTNNSDSEDEKKEKAAEKKEEEDEGEIAAVETAAEAETEEVKDDKVAVDVVQVEKPEKPKALHKTTSIFLRNLAPTITKQEVEAVCARYDGFLRVALADPQPERRWLRRGWVTFKRNANIKEICWNLNNIRLRDCELGAIVNRDLSRRIRPINGITAHKQIVRSDIRIAAKVVLHLDNKAGLWLSNDEKKDKPQQTFGLVSNNPILHNITDYLIEEASAEEEELLGLEPTSDTQDTIGVVERDDILVSVLDRIILYLRIVHSVDYYNHCEYPNEDEMPNRCGILHARGPPPTSKTDMTQFIGAPIETKMANFLPEKPRDENKNETKLLHLSLKDVDTEIDKFVQANTRELAKDKWLCPLSGKKFKGPDFVRKHIFNKHAEKIEEVKKEVEFFNNYLKDPKRPMLAEAPQPKREDTPTYNHPSYGGSFGGVSRPPPYYNQGYSQRSRGFNSRARGGGDFRPVIHYRDLDAPREPEEFI